MIIIVILISLTYSANVVQPFDGRHGHGTGVAPTNSEVQSFDGFCRLGLPSECDDSGEFQVVGEIVESYTREECFDWAMEDLDATAFSWSDDGKCIKYGGSDEYTHGSRVNCVSPANTRCYVKQITSERRRRLATCTVGVLPSNLIPYSSISSVAGCVQGATLVSDVNSCAVTCASGYHLYNYSPYGVIICNSNGQGISGWPTCYPDPEDCTVPSFGSPLVAHTVNSNIQGCAAGATLSPGGYPCAVKCSSGYQLNGGAPYATITCSSSGVVSGIPSCYATTTTTTGEPSGFPSHSPSVAPTVIPTSHPTKAPFTSIPTSMPTETPSASPTASPSNQPTVSPTLVPSENPTVSPSLVPSENPTTAPTKSPSHAPSVDPTTTSPTTMPSHAPSRIPTTTTPSTQPSASPSLAPSVAPTAAASEASHLIDFVNDQVDTVTILLFLALIVAGSLMYYCRRLKVGKQEKDIEAADGSMMAFQGSEMVALGSMLSVISGTDVGGCAVVDSLKSVPSIPSATPEQNSDIEQDPADMELVDEISREVVREDSEKTQDKNTWLGSEIKTDNEQLNTDYTAVDVHLIE